MRGRTGWQPVALIRLSAGALAAVLLAGPPASPSAVARPAYPSAVAGTTAASVPLPSTGTCDVEPRFAKNDFRAMWIASVENIDWPSRPGLSVARQQAELRGWLDLAVRLNLNAVVLQVRPTADAMWPSSYEPWSRWLTGTQGEHPGYDPLAFAVAEAHQRNLGRYAVGPLPGEQQRQRQGTRRHPPCPAEPGLGRAQGRPPPRRPGSA